MKTILYYNTRRMDKKQYKIKGTETHNRINFTLYRRAKIIFFYLWLPKSSHWGDKSIVQDTINELQEWYDIPSEMIKIKKNK